MSNSILPDTDNPTAMQMAIAYEIVHRAFPVNIDQSDEGAKKYLIKLTNAQIKIYSAIHNVTPLNVDDIKLD